MILACITTFPTGSVLLVTIFLLLSLLGLNFFSRHYFKKRERPALIFTLFFICLLIGTIGLDVYWVSDYYYKLNHKSLMYSLQLTSSSAGYDLVYLPISSDDYLQNTVRVDTGSGTIAIIDTNYGEALLVYFKGAISISGKIDTMAPLNNYTLTLVNQTQYNETEFWLDIGYWVFYLPSNISAYECSFRFSLLYQSEHMGLGEACNGSLTPGWTTYCGRSMGYITLC